MMSCKIPFDWKLWSTSRKILNCSSVSINHPPNPLVVAPYPSQLLLIFLPSSDLFLKLLQSVLREPAQVFTKHGLLFPIHEIGIQNPLNPLHLQTSLG